MDIILIIVFALLAILTIICVLFTKKGEYITSSYKINPYIDKNGCIELLVCDPYIKKKSFLINYKYSAFLEEKNDICITFIQIPIIHWKPRIIDIYINKEKITE